MSIELVTSWHTLMQYAHALGKARLSGDETRIAEAQRRHDAYVQVCLESDRMMMHMTMGELYSGRKR